MNDTDLSPVYDASRVAAVVATGLLDTGPEAAFDELAALAASLLGAPFAFVTLVDDQRSFWKARVGIPAEGPNQNRVEESFCQYVIASGEPLIAGDVTTNPLTAGNPSIESMGVRAWAGNPLLSPDGHALGSFCVVDTVTRSWTDTDVEVLRVLSAAASRELALRAAARENAALYAREQAISSELSAANTRLRSTGRHDRGVARALQDAMLPRLPEPHDLQLVARYLTADSADQVGGDWYDSLQSRDGATTLMVGDVAGHDIAAATVMGHLRNILRTLAWEHPHDPPSALIERLDRAMPDLGLSTMTTLVVARIHRDPGAEQDGVRTLRWSCAGHPGPVLIDVDGTPALLAGPPDPPLATTSGVVRRDHVATIASGQTLLLYTDGLIENRAEHLGARQERLLEVIAGSQAPDLDGLLDTVLAQMVGGEPDDDVAVLATRFV